MLLAFAAPSMSQAAPPNPGGSLTVSQVTGTVAGGGTLLGTFDPTRFRSVNDALTVTGTLQATLYNAAGTIIGTVTQTITFDVTAVPQAVCTILDLTLGPLDLDLLGLQVHLNQVHLVIEAVSGPGNLLGNLLCAIAHVLDDGNPLGDIAGLLNRILRLLG
ncbi:MAG TPA: hypothetical protein VFM54_02840 [Micromonosporaceae bacterium]|nr:hypothetical protein [Micromonosporaceae bacterium]